MSSHFPEAARWWEYPKKIQVFLAFTKMTIYFYPVAGFFLRKIAVAH
jgi:hypothetical protein